MEVLNAAQVDLTQLVGALHELVAVLHFFLLVLVLRAKRTRLMRSQGLLVLLYLDVILRTLICYLGVGLPRGDRVEVLELHWPEGLGRVYLLV